MKGFFQLICVEFWEIKHDLRRPAFLFGAALAYLLVFGLLYVPNIVTAVPTVILDEDNSALSRQLVRDFEASDSYQITAYVTSQEEMRASLRDKVAIATIDIPHDFAKKAKNGSYSTVLYLTNGANIILTNITSSAAQNITEDFSNRLAAQQVALRYGLDEGRVAHYIAPVTVHLRVLYNATQGYMFFFLIGLAMIAFQQGIIFAVGASSLYEVEHTETMQGYSMAETILAKTTVYWTLAMCSYLLVILGITQRLGIALHAPLWQLLLLAAVFILAVIGFCFFFASFFPAELPFVRAAILYPVPCFIFSGYTWPIESMGAGMQLVAQFFPFTHFSNTVRDLFLIGSAANYTLYIEKLIGLMLLFFLVGGWQYSRRLRKKLRQQSHALPAE